MGLKLNRVKPRNWTLTLLYRLFKIPFISKENKFKLFLNLEWIFERLAHEKSFEYYSPENHPLRVYSNNYILSLLKESDSVIDLGCHAGHITSVLAKKVKKVVGIDYDKSAIEFAKKTYHQHNLLFINDEISHYLNENNEKFDVLILSHIIEHIENPLDLISKCKPFVRFMYIEVPDFDKTYLNHYRQDLNLSLIYTDIDHISEFDRIEIKELINKSGFKLIESEYRFGVQRHWCEKINE